MKKMLAAALALCLFAPAAASAGGAQPLTLWAINVGKADCLLLTCGESAYLIDTGTAAGWGQVSAALAAAGLRRLDGVVITHTHKDHAGGAMALAQTGIEIAHWYAPRYYTGVKPKKHPAVLAAAVRGAEVEWLQSGDSLPLDGGTLRVLGPTEFSETENCNSLVLLAETDSGSILLAGDMEFPEEQALMNRGLIAPATVLKVGNHGESDATSEAFARAVSPRLALISTDSAEEPDTPSKRVLRALKDVGAQIALTQNAEAGVRVTLSEGDITLDQLAWSPWPDALSGLKLTAVDSARDTVTLRNDGEETADLSGCFIFSERGGEIFVFPEGAALAPGASLTVSAGNSPVRGDYVWPEDKVWHKSKPDPAVLFDRYGRQLDRLE